MGTTRARRVYMRDYMRVKREKLRRVAESQVVSPERLDLRPENPAAAVAAWAAAELVIPPGHPRAGDPFVIPDYGVRFLADVFDPDVREIALVIARKNSKSGIVAVLLLAHLVGPVKRSGWRAGVCSLNRAKASELRMQARSIAEASAIGGLKFARGNIESRFGRVDVLSADKDAGAASGFDVAIVDEIGLLEERNRDLLNGMRSSVSARDGKFLSLSVFGSGPFVPEILKRDGDPALRIHLYQADVGARLDDEAQWHKANPGLAPKIKSLEYMRTEARRVLVTVADQASFRALDLNLPGVANRAMLVLVADWCACETDALPGRAGPCYVGIDLGGSTSMTAAVAYWPETRRLETFAAFPDTPSLGDRGQVDGAGGIYERARTSGELTLHAGRVVDAGRFVSDLLDGLTGADVKLIGCDRFRKAEAASAFDVAPVPCRVVWRGTGKSATADGSADIRAFQAAVVTQRIQAVESELLRLALSEAQIDADSLGNPALAKSKSTGRIDLVQAGVIAVGLAALDRPRGNRGPGYALA